MAFTSRNHLFRLAILFVKGKKIKIGQEAAKKNKQTKSGPKTQ